VQSADALAAYIRESLHTANALVGTCRMGKPSDPEAVVDPSLRVRSDARITITHKKRLKTFASLRATRVCMSAGY
jgi:choline dehydrogenase